MTSFFGKAGGVLFAAHAQRDDCELPFAPLYARLERGAFAQQGFCLFSLLVQDGNSRVQRGSWFVTDIYVLRCIYMYYDVLILI